MKPPNVTSVLLVGLQDSHKSSFLMQGAVHYAEQGHTIIYITANEFDSLPLPIQGMTRPTPDVFSLIKFLYLPCWQDLLQHVYSLHLHALVPTVIIVDSLEHFCAAPDRSDVYEPSSRASEASHAALVCAALLDGTAVCAKRSKGQAHLIVSLNQDSSDPKMSPLIDIYFTDVVWMFEKASANRNSSGDTGDYSMTNLETTGSSVKHYNISFSPEQSVGAVVVNKISFWQKIQGAPP
ncbi:uncharacterized protein LOC117653128 [Thrips palmi]|uniref:Uncharacterized protein LOC117653128 n=1 Tax=Thrips palmi TaxID=161013 RepID=A0A6P9A8T5_THRPL|nr:uncharacterized protein LOC117653128 [Thrips palmi]